MQRKAVNVEKDRERHRKEAKEKGKGKGKEKEKERAAPHHVVKDCPSSISQVRRGHRLAYYR